MLSPKLRRKLLMKWAQAVPGAPAAPGAPASPASPTSPDSPASPNSPTQPESTTQATLGSPPPFDPTGGPWAWITSAYNSATVGYLAYLLRTVNTALWYASNGKYDMGKYQNSINSMDESAAGSDNGKNAVLLAKMFYNTFLHGGQSFTPNATEINAWADRIITSGPLQQLTQMNPTGPAAQQMKLDASLRTTIVNYLGYIKQYNPVQQPQR